MKSTSGWRSYSGKMECPQCSNWSSSKKAGTQCDRCNDKGEIEYYKTFEVEVVESTEKSE